VIALSHNPALVALSVLVSVLGAYAALAIFERFKDARGRAWLAWLATGAIVDAIGTWSMHYTGKLALRLPFPIELDIAGVLVSFVVALLGSTAALVALGGPVVSWRRALAASVLLGGATITGLHYTAMSALRIPAAQHHSHAIAVLASFLAMSISLIALALIFLVPPRVGRPRLRYHAGAFLRGIANPAMHYTAMAGMTLTPAAAPDLSHAVGISALGVLGASVVPVTLLVVALLTSLVDRLRSASAEIRRVSGRLSEIQDEERRRLAAELHDIVGQTLSALNAELALIRTQLPPGVPPDLAEKLAELSRRVRQSVEAVRNVMVQLRPPGLDELGLAAALRWRAEELGKRSGIDVSVDAEPLPKPAAAIEDALLRICGEALANAVSHAQARAVRIRLETRGDDVAMTVEDDGRGFDTGAPRRRDERSGWGLTIMQERAAAVGGRVEVDSAAGSGTRVRFLVPRTKWS
jgi:signal transduction histidine kinase